MKLSLIATALLLCLTATAVNAQRPPNVVLIISDDQTYTDFGFMGNRLVSTPNLDQLAAASARFTHGYVPTSVCRPSLATILTGLYPHQHGIHFNHPPPGFSKLTKTPSIDKTDYDALRAKGAALIQRCATLPGLLTASRGYRCLQTGKFWEGHYSGAGFTDGMTIAQPSGGKYGDKQLAGGESVAHGNGDHGLAIGRETMKPIDDFLEDCGGEPFMIWYAPFLPHTPHDAPQRYFDLLNANVPAYKRPYYASIAQFDDTVGQLIQSIKQRQLFKDTLFVFVVDNGWSADPARFNSTRGEWDHTKHSKRAPFDAGLRTPILFCWQSRTIPATYDAPVSTVDLLPTLLAAAGIENRPSTPGVNLWPVVTGSRQGDPDRAVFGAIYPGDATVLGNPSADVAYRWVRCRHHKLIVPVVHAGKPPWNRYLDGPALYDVRVDPDERTNLIADPALAETIQRLQTKLDDWWLPVEQQPSK